MKCKHTEFKSMTKVTRLVDEHELAFPDKVKPNGLAIEVTVNCIQCGAPVYFTGMGMGVAFCGARMSFDNKEARLSATMDEPAHLKGAKNGD